jgi:hypothetical protein
VEGSSSDLILMYSPGICLDTVNKTMKHIITHCFMAETWTVHSSNRSESRLSVNALGRGEIDSVRNLCA